MKLEQYARRLAKKTGTPVLEEIILGKRTMKDLPAECMPWTGRKTISNSRLRPKIERDHNKRPYKTLVPETPYGLIIVEGKRLLVHRYIFVLLKKPFYEFTMRNHCGNTLCCNPMHWLVHGEPEPVPFPHEEAFLAALEADWTQSDVNWTIDQALAKYSLTSWEDVINNVMLEECPHDMLVVGLKEYRRPGLLPIK